MKLQSSNIYTALEDVVLRTQTARFYDLSLEAKRELTIYALNDDENFESYSIIYFADFMPALLMQYNLGKISAQEMTNRLIDYATRQLQKSIETMYDECAYALAIEGLLAWPKDWDRPETDYRRGE